MPDSVSLGSMADSVTSNFSELTKLITSTSYLAGLGFSAASIAKFKSHKDNPTQVPVGTPTALLAVSAVQAFLSSVKATAAEAGVTLSEVKAAAAEAGVTTTEVEATASAAGVTSSEVSAAESALKAKLSK